MKFLKCRKCGDLVALRLWDKNCKCGSSWGVFLADNRTASVSGDCIVLGFPNDQFFEIKEPNEFIKRY